MQYFPELVLRRAQLQPDALAYRFLQGTSPPETLSYRELWLHAAALAHELTQRGCVGQRALLVCKSQRNFVVGFYACLLGGVIVVPTAAPRRQLLRSRLQLIAQDARACMILSDFDELGQTGIDADCMSILDLRAFAASVDSAELAARFVPVCVGGDDLAFLQYTSGSTGEPKGVAVSHSNLVHNSETICAAMGTSESSAVLIALPLFHDMGLVGGVLQSMYVGCTTTFMPPAELVQYPERWLRLISSMRITTSGGPNFIYELAANEVRPEDVQGLDLSSWQVAFCGAEPIRASTISNFTRRFSEVGFNHGAFYPCYGMAEATLFIAGGRVGEPPATAQRDGAEVVCCGSPYPGTNVRIVDPESRQALPDGEVGEIWVSGDSVAQGYWMREVHTEQAFRARIEGVADHAHYLRTGDVGWLSDGQLYVSGRLKDVIIVSGRKYAPQDMEAAAEEASQALRRGGAAAFGVTVNGTDRLVIVAELEREWLRRTSEWPAIARAIRAAINTAHGIGVADIVLTRPGALPRTSSGKLRRAQSRADYLAGEFRAVLTEEIA